MVNYIEDHIYYMDCIDYINMMSSNKIKADLAVLDPPYNMNKAKWDKFQSYELFLRFTFSWLTKIKDIMVPNGSLYIFNTPYNCAKILSKAEFLGYKFQNWITWDKRDGQGGSKNRFTRRQESILFLTMGDSHVFNFNDVRVPYESTDRIASAAKKGIIKNGKRWFPNPAGRLCGDVWHITSERHKEKIKGKIKISKHVTPKPIELVERLIKASSNKSDLVVDIFMGSGTTAKAAQNLGRRYTGCDSSKEYVEYAINRLSLTKGRLLL